MTRSVAFANNKGGVGKSTVSVNTVAAHAKEHPDKKILFVDCTFTSSIASALLGDAPPSSLADLITRLSVVSRRRQDLFIVLMISAPFLLGFSAYLSSAVSMLSLALAGATSYFFGWRYVSRSVNPLEYASKSTLFPNLHVLVGGATLAGMSKNFPYDTACNEFKVPADIDLVVFDIDNTLDDYARWALSMSDAVVVPASLSDFDFARLETDPRNGALFDFVSKLEKRPEYRGVVFNRARCTGSYKEDDENECGWEFKVSSGDARARDALKKRFLEHVSDDCSFAMLREIPGNILSAMLCQKLPIVSLELDSGRDTLQAAADNLRMVAEKIF